MIEELKELGKYVDIIESNSEDYSISYLEPVCNYYEEGEDRYKIKVSKIEGKVKQTDISKLKKILIDKIIELSDNDLEKNKLFELNFNSDDLEENVRILLRKIFMASNYIASNSKIGPANRVLISKENYDKYNLYNNLSKELFNIFIDDSIGNDSIYVYRQCGDNYQPGLSLVTYGDKYELVEKGDIRNQFVKITLK